MAFGVVSRLWVGGAVLPIVALGLGITPALAFEKEATEARLANTPPPSQLPFSFGVKAIYLKPSPKTLRQRLLATTGAPQMAEAVVLRVNHQEARPILMQLAKNSIIEDALDPTKAKNVLDSFDHEVLKKRVQNGKITLGAQDLAWLDLRKLSNTLKQPSFQAALPREAAQPGSPLYGALAHHLGPAVLAAAHNGPQERPPLWDPLGQVVAWAQKHPHRNQIPLSQLLPSHVLGQLGRYSSLRGRNCFVTALNFADRGVEHVSTVNVVREPGHHSSLINHDEFIHSLGLGYRQLEAQEVEEGLYFGDVVVFVDGSMWPHYQSALHAVVHMGGTVYLHKQSKSAGSPIEFTQWEKLIATWTPLAKKLEYKVFRRIPSGPLAETKQRVSVEKILWTE